MSAPTLCYSPAINPSHPLMRGVVGRWKVLPWYASGPRLIDISGFNHPGALTNGPTWAGRSVGGFGSISFDGNDDYVGLGLKFLSTSPYPYALAANIYLTAYVSGGADFSTIIVKTRDWYFQVDPTGLLAAYLYGVSSAYSYSTTALALKTWYHVVFVYDSSTFKFYINGKLDVSINVSGTPAPSGTECYVGIGANLDESGNLQVSPRNFAGLMDDVMRINRALSASEVRALYDATSRRDDPTLNWIRPVTYFGVTAVTGIQFDAKSNSGYQTLGTSISWSHTCAGSNRFLAVDVELLSLAGTTVSSITYNGVNLSPIGTKGSTTGAVRVECWGLIAPATGSNTIVVTFSGSIAAGASAGEAVSYTGVDQAIAVEEFNSASATNVGAADATVTITTASNNAWVHAAVATDDASITANQTSRSNVTGTLGSGADEDTGPITPPGTQAMSYTAVGALATWAIAGYAIKPVGSVDWWPLASRMSSPAVDPDVFSPPRAFPFSAFRPWRPHPRQLFDPLAEPETPWVQKRLVSPLLAPYTPATVNFCGFETGDFSECSQSTGTVSIQATTTRTGGYALRSNPTTTAGGSAFITSHGPTGAKVQASVSHSFFRFYFRYATKPASNDEEIFVAENASQQHVFSIRLNSSGNLAAYRGGTTLMATGTTVLAANVWYRIEAKLLNGTSAPWEVMIDGVSEISGTATITTNNIGAARLGKDNNRNGNTVDFFYDDFFWSAGSAYPGAGQCTVLLPNANGTYQTWTIGAGSGSHYQQVNEVPPDNDTTYLVSPTGQGNAETEALTDTGTAGVSGTVKSVKAAAIVARDNALLGSEITLRLRSGSTNSDPANTFGTAFSPTASYALIAKVFDTDPATSSPWAVASLDSVESGCVEGTTAGKTRLTFTAVMVDYLPLGVTTWQPFATRLMPGPPDAEIPPSRALLNAALMPGFTAPVISWQPFAVRAMPAPAEADVPPSRALLNAALMSGVTPLPWQPFAVRAMPPLPVPEVPAGRVVLSPSLLTGFVSQVWQPFRSVWTAPAVELPAPSARSTLSPILLPGWTGASPWQPFASRYMIALPDDRLPPWPRALLNVGLLPGSTPPPWFPVPVKFMPGPGEPDVPASRALLNAALMPRTVTTPWQPFGIRVSQAMVEETLPASRSILNAALLPGFVVMVTPWQPLSVKLMPGPGEPEIPPSRALLNVALMPGFSLVPWWPLARRVFDPLAPASVDDVRRVLAFWMLPPDWRPFGRAKEAPPVEPTPFSLRNVLNATFLPQWVSTASPWQPWASKFMPGPPEPPIPDSQRILAAALRPGFTGPNIYYQPIRQPSMAEMLMPGPQPSPFDYGIRHVPPAYLVTVPTVPPAPSSNRPFLARFPPPDRRLGRFTDMLSDVFNSLVGEGQLLQTGAKSYKIVGLSELMQLEPQQFAPPRNPAFGILWMDMAGHLHYLSPGGTDTIIA